MSQCTLPGREQVAVYEQGPPDGPPLLLFHGSPGGSLGSWSSIARGLSDTFHLIAIDYPGHGAGPRPAQGFRGEPFSFDTVVEDAMAVLDARGIGKVTVLGYSLGGAPALLFARHHQDRVQGLVLCSTALRFPRIRSAALLERIAGTSGSTPRSVTRRSAGIPCRIRGRLGEVLRTNIRAAAQAELAAEAFDATSWIREIRVPTAVVISHNDSVVATASQEELAAASGAKRVLLGGRRGHLAIPFSSAATRKALRDVCLGMAGEGVSGPRHGGTVLS